MAQPGPRKLRKRLGEDNPNKPISSTSVIGKVLKRRGMTTPRRRRRRVHAAGVTARFSGGTDDGRRCYPLTLIDAFSRYLNLL